MTKAGLSILDLAAAYRDYAKRPPRPLPRPKRPAPAAEAEDSDQPANAQQPELFDEEEQN